MLVAAGEALASVLDDGARGEDRGIDIVVTYPHWPRAWQVEADWLRFAAEGGYVREVISHFLFFSARVLGPLRLVWARPTWPADPALWLVVWPLQNRFSRFLTRWRKGITTAFGRDSGSPTAPHLLRRTSALPSHGHPCFLRLRRHIFQRQVPR